MQKKLNNKGFTIVEVLIVLAIAGAILAGILLAVPALQRNSRNTQLKTAANDVLAAIGDYTASNNGKVPTCISFTGTTLTVGTDTVGTSPCATSTKTYQIPGIITAISGVAAAAGGDLPSTTGPNTIKASNGGCATSSTFGTTAGSSWGVEYVANGTSTVTCIGS